jgi:large subunit ribosomal protein L10
MSAYVTKITNAKTGAVDALKNSFDGVKDFIFTDYRGLTVEQVTELRSKLREMDAEYHVVKNNFAKIAFKDLKLPEMDGYFVGPTALAYAKGESGPVAKELFKMQKEWSLEVKGGLVDGNVFDKTQIEAYSKLPTKPELLGKLLGTINAPLQNLVYAMNGVVTKLVRTLQAVADSKE